VAAHFLLIRVDGLDASSVSEILLILVRKILSKGGSCRPKHSSLLIWKRPE
jgi:hypothetical protein